MTVAKLISLARRHFDTFDDAEALTYAQAVHNKILRLIRVKPDEDVDISVTAGVNSYTLDANQLISRIWNATWYDSATSFRPLRPRSVDELDFQTRGIWRTQPASTPIWYDERAGKLILYPTPDTTTATGYPKVTLTVQKTDTLTTSTVLPTAIDEYDAWIYGLCRKYAGEKARDQFQMFDALYTQALNDLVAFSQGKAAREMPNIQPNIPVPNIS
jgi:hypothetical protein